MTNFDYDVLSIDDAAWLRSQKQQVEGFWRDEIAAKIRIGQSLIEIKARIGHGNYEAWVEAEFAWGKATAKRWVNLAVWIEQAATETLTVSFLPLEKKIQLLQQFTARALYAVTSPCADGRLVQGAFELAIAGQRVTVEDLKRLQAQIDVDCPPKSKSSPKVDLLPGLVDTIATERLRNEMVERTVVDILRTPIQVQRPGTYRIADILPPSVVKKLEAINLWSTDLAFDAA